MTEYITLFDQSGHRKYLNSTEREQFKKAAELATREIRTFCHMLLNTGCRISEALNLTTDRLDIAGGLVVFESLKKRTRGIYRAVPISPTYIDDLILVHGLKENKSKKTKRIWSFARSTASLKVAEVMRIAGIKGIHATPKGLRHAFGVACVEKNIPINLIQKWLGHSDLSTTAIYLNVVGEEEKNIAAKLWN